MVGSDKNGATCAHKCALRTYSTLNPTPNRTLKPTLTWLLWYDPLSKAIACSPLPVAGKPCNRSRVGDGISNHRQLPGQRVDNQLTRFQIQAERMQNILADVLT